MKGKGGKPFTRNPTFAPAAVTARALIRLTINAGQASAGPPIGPTLGQKGLKAFDFCKQFNEQSKKFLPGIPLPTRIRIFPDKSFSFVIKPPTTFSLLKIACKFEKGSTQRTVARVPVTVIYEVAEIKKCDPGFANIPFLSVFKTILNEARHVGIEVLP